MGLAPTGKRRLSTAHGLSGHQYWLSFAGDDGFRGVVIVDLTEEEIGSEPLIVAAVDKTIRLAINTGPDYEVRGREL